MHIKSADVKLTSKLLGLVTNADVKLEIGEVNENNDKEILSFLNRYSGHKLELNETDRGRDYHFFKNNKLAMYYDITKDNNALLHLDLSGKIVADILSNIMQNETTMGREAYTELMTLGNIYKQFGNTLLDTKIIPYGTT